jgi:hypothetical protein
MLARMETSPSAVFYEKELAGPFPADFEWAKKERLLRRVQTQVDGGSYSFGQGRTLTVVSDDGQIEAFDDEDPEFDPIELTPADLARWRLDLESVARRFQEANGLRGAPGRLHDRLFFLGVGERNGVRASFVLGLLHEARSAQTVLLSLPSLLPTTSHRIAIVCPTFAVAPSELRQLESLNISVVRLGDPDPFLLGDPAIWEASSLAQPSAQPSGKIFRREGEYWTIGDQGLLFRLRNTKGFRYTAYLLRHPGREFHVVDLVAAVEGTRQQSETGAYTGMTSEQLAECGLAVSEGKHSEFLLDAQARIEYQTRIRELQEEIDEAERNNNSELAANLKEERDSILDQLLAASGLGGRDRRTSSPAERARINVTKQVGKALARIEKQHEALGRHLRNAIRTGAFCSYSPETPTDWVL